MLSTLNRAGRILVCFAALATFFTGCAPRGARALLEGRDLIDAGRYPEAVEELRVATSLLRTNAQAWNYLGLALHLAGRATNAVEAYQRALALDQDLMEAHFNLGCLSLEQNQLDAARAEFTAYTLRRGNLPEGWIKLGTAQLRSARGDARSPELAAAERSFNEALKLNPRSLEALNGLGVVRFHRASMTAAAQAFNNALKLQPDYAPALLNLAVMSHLHLNDRPQALKKYQEYLALPGRPANWQSVNAVAEALERELTPPAPRPPAHNVAVAAKAPESKAATNTAVRAQHTSKPDPATNVAKAASGRAPVEEVKVAPEPVVKPAPSLGSPPVRVQPANPTPSPPTMAAAAQRPRAEAPVRGGSPDVSQESDGPRYRYLSPAAPVAGDRDAATEAFDRGVKAYQENRLSDAIQAYQQATRRDPAYYDAYYNLGLAAARAGNLPQALRAYEVALAIRSESLDARYNFALVLKQANYLADATREFEKLLAIYPNEARAHLVLGNLYAQQLRQPDKARGHYLKVLESDPGNPQAPNIRYWLTANQP